MTIHDPSTTLASAAQPKDDRRIRALNPTATVSTTVAAATSCGARIRGSTNSICIEPPVEGRRRCHVHGGATPAGHASPHFRSGRRSRFPVPLTADESERYEAYKRAVFDPKRQDLASDLALMRLMLERAVASGGSGVAEAGAVARLALAHARITDGRVIRVELDEVMMGRFIDSWMGVVDRHVRDTLGPDEGKRLVGRIALELQNGMKQLESPTDGGS